MAYSNYLLSTCSSSVKTAQTYAVFFFSRGQNIQDEENDSDDDIPDLKPLVHSSESKTTSPILLNNMNMIYDDDKTEWEEDCPPRFARNRIQHVRSLNQTHFLSFHRLPLYGVATISMSARVLILVQIERGTMLSVPFQSSRQHGGSNASSSVKNR
mmetsp:Transcript_2479/g.3249  ORF Transcript_2479/g.3249 Transcript_2479/m.3249 type:complete len:156 (-) Transcript_2479:141-608(-)